MDEKKLEVLIVEDNVKLAKTIGYILEEAGYNTTVAYDGEAGFNLGSSLKYDLIILDIMLPKMDGNEVCTKLRRSGIDTAILMLTAKDSVRSKIEGYDSGADDYMTKPFSASELLAHLRALQRRHGKVIFETLNYKDLVMHIPSQEISCNDQSIHLTKKEFKILQTIVAANGATVSKSDIIKDVWGEDSEITEQSIHAYISFLRDKMELIGTAAAIDSISKAGYRIVDSKQEK